MWWVGYSSGLCAPEWCEKSREIKSLVVQWGGTILTYGATLVLLRCLCLYNVFLGPFSLVLSRASFSYPFCLNLTQIGSVEKIAFFDASGLYALNRQQEALNCILFIFSDL